MREGRARVSGISGSTLKLIAIGAMLMDHIGAVILEPMLLQRHALGMITGPLEEDLMFQVYYFFRMVIGRAAFPVFCFLLTEGMQRTSHKGRYFLRLLLFAGISEVPFDLAIMKSAWDWSYQNVFFTLAIGLGTMCCVEKIKERCGNVWLRAAAQGGCVILGMSTADFLKTDYCGYGVLCMMVLYFFRKNRWQQLIAGAVIFPLGEWICLGTTSELLAPLGLIPAARYNGERGRNSKYLFYWFYPLHLLVLYGVRVFII